VNASPEDSGWFFKIKLANKAELGQLMTEQKYQDYVKGL
jgi:glycine cleavage system H lipoate-binding protein